MNRNIILTTGIAVLIFTTGLLAGIDVQDEETNIKEQDTKNTDKKYIKVTGTVEKIEVTCWMYGTHLIQSNDNSTRYALKNESLDLAEYEGEEVTIKGNLVHEGLDGGPPLIEVNCVEL